jgi:uroporphyrinogen-III decarboxylase
MIQEDDFAWNEPLAGSKPDILRRLADIDPREGVRNSRLWRLYQDMRELAQAMAYRGLPVRIGFPGGTHGIFTIACRVRGEEQLCVDLLEDPDFATSLLRVVTDKTIGRLQAWHELAETGAELPSPSGWGMADDSLQVISRDTYEQMLLPHHERIYSAMTGGKRHMHLCGYAQQHFETLYAKLGIRSLDGPGPFVDHGPLLAEMPELTISAQADHTTLMLGPVSDIDDMMRGMLTDGSKQPGRYVLSGFLARQTPLEHVRAMYEAGRRHGVIDHQRRGELVRDAGQR